MFPINVWAAAGPLITDEIVGSLPPGPGVGPSEGVVRVPRQVMIDAVMDIIRGA
jgi:hypothetical protein